MSQLCNNKPAVIWFTGLSGSGKSAIAEELYRRMKSDGMRVEHLDGDNIRNLFSKIGFTKEERDQHIKRVGRLASGLERGGVYVIATFISPYEETRRFVRALCKNFIEVYVSTPIEECERRDVKGLYAKARRNEIEYFTGVSDPYEIPSNPELIINTCNVSVDKACNIITSYIKENRKAI